MDRKVTAKARVQVTIMVETAAWGEDCTIGQLYDQAAKSAIEQVRNLRHWHGSTPASLVTIVGEPKVTGVITEEV